MDALVELPSRRVFRRVRAARLALDERAPAGTGVVWIPRTIGAVPEEMDFEESIRRRFASADPDRLAKLYGHAWAQRRAAVLAQEEGAAELLEDDEPGELDLADDDLEPEEECERCQMRQRWGAGRCARCEAEESLTPSTRRSSSNDLLALVVAAAVVLAVISWTVISVQRSGDTTDVNRCVRVVGDAADINGC